MSKDDTPTADEASAKLTDGQASENDSEGSTKPGGLGKDGTIPNDFGGVAAGHTGEASNFEPEEDEHVE